jgi:hypothetical protein
VSGAHVLISLAGASVSNWMLEYLAPPRVLGCCCRNGDGNLRESAARTAGVVGVIESAATTDPEIAALWRKLRDQGLHGMTLAAKGFQEQGVLRPGLTVARAADILWLYLGPWSYRVLVAERGWTLDDYEAWLAGTLYTQVMSNG